MQKPLIIVIPERAVVALGNFFKLEAAGGILLIAAAALALLCANSPLDQTYRTVLDTTVEVRVGLQQIDKPLLLWINDGLMAVFFLMVALEIKREAMHGQLSSRSQLALPLACAAGGHRGTGRDLHRVQSCRPGRDDWRGNSGGDRYRVCARDPLATRFARTAGNEGAAVGDRRDR